MDRIYDFLASVINLVVTFVVALLALRLLLRFFGASSTTPFVAWIYDTTAPILAPFRGAFPASVVDGRYVLEISTIFAIIVYALIGYFLVYLVGLVPHDHEDHDHGVARRSHH